MPIGDEIEGSLNDTDLCAIYLERAPAEQRCLCPLCSHCTGSIASFKTSSIGRTTQKTGTGQGLDPNNPGMDLLPPWGSSLEVY